MKTIIQSNSQDCLITCYSMILSYYNIYNPSHNLVNDEEISSDGLSLNYLKKLNKIYKLNMKVYKIAANENIGYLKNFSSPLIAYWDREHFIVIKKVKKRKITIIDPAIGKIDISKEEFLEHFAGIIVHFTPQTEWEEKNHSLKFRNDNLFSNKSFLVYLCYLFLSIICLISLFYCLHTFFFDKKLSFKYFIVFFCIIILNLLRVAFYHFILSLSLNECEQKTRRSLFITSLKNNIFFFKNTNPDSIIANINECIKDRYTYKCKMYDLIICVTSIFVAFVYMGIVSLCAMLLLLIISILFINTNIYIVKYRKKIMNEYVYYSKRLNSILKDDICQIDYIKAKNLERLKLDKWMKISEEKLNKKRKLQKNSTFIKLAYILYNFIFILIILLGLSIRPDYNLHSSILSIIFIVFLFISYQTNKISTFMVDLIKINQENTKKFKRPNSYFKKNDLIEFNNNAISVRDVSFTSPLGTEVLRNVNFDIKKGEKVAIIGEGGSGKTTLLNIILGLYRSKGEIIYGYKNFRENLGVVFQNNFIKEESMLDNLDIKSENIDFGELEGILKDVDLLDLVNKKPRKIQTQLLHQANNLSKSEIQRFLIAKSLLNNQFILGDELFDKFDDKKQIDLYNNILKNSKYLNHTIIFTSNDTKVLEYVTKIIYIDNNRVYVGTHNYLINTNNNFKRFINND
ncbi:cysteine peptidase family C39 domain-containing protein [uncultured Staphylococcus sp.]|uniref:cysteine peptidase family C39 domain-containing protein n=1 Tax=uncultured Staphylococcus sp. TaxID=189668 RepID=UPI0026014C23|nr:cysteine peptidase family C39 domain-containing protein [uncultured Staphylococcus sp.]